MPLSVNSKFGKGYEVNTEHRIVEVMADGVKSLPGIIIDASKSPELLTGKEFGYERLCVG